VDTFKFLCCIITLLSSIILIGCQKADNQIEGTERALGNNIIESKAWNIRETEIEIMWQQLLSICQNYELFSEQNCYHKTGEICQWDGSIKNISHLTMQRIANIKDSTCSLWIPYVELLEQLKENDICYDIWIAHQTRLFYNMLYDMTPHINACSSNS